MDLPPPVMKQQVRNLSAQQDIKFLQGALPKEAVGDRLPMLQALRDFMQGEQRKTRRQTAVMATVLAAALLAGFGISLWAAWSWSRPPQKQLAAVQAGLAEVRQDTQVLKGEVEARLKNWPAEAAALQAAIAELETSVGGMKTQLAAALSGMVEGASSTSPMAAVLQELQLVRAEKLELELRQAALQREGEQLVAAGARREEQRTRLAREQEQLASEVKDFAARYQEAQERLQKLRETPGAGEVDPAAVVGRTRRDAALLGLNTRPTAAMLEELYRLRNEQLDLQARKALLQKELDDLESDQRFNDLRQQRLEGHRAELAAQVEAFLNRQRDLRDRLAQLQGATPAAEADVSPLLESP